MAYDATQEITATVVPQSERINFLPSVFGERLFLRGEFGVYSWLQQLSASYTGGFWNFYRLTNGGFYMAPEVLGQEALEIVVPLNGYCGVVSADAAGIIATLFTLSHLSFELGSRHPDVDRIAEAYHALRDFVPAHPEASKIHSAID